MKSSSGYQECRESCSRPVGPVEQWACKAWFFHYYQIKGVIALFFRIGAASTSDFSESMQTNTFQNNFISSERGS